MPSCPVAVLSALFYFWRLYGPQCTTRLLHLNESRTIRNRLFLRKRIFLLGIKYPRSGTQHSKAAGRKQAIFQSCFVISRLRVLMAQAFLSRSASEGSSVSPCSFLIRPPWVHRGPQHNMSLKHLAIQRLKSQGVPPARDILFIRGIF